jgi:hypothetical protein
MRLLADTTMLTRSDLLHFPAKLLRTYRQQTLQALPNKTHFSNLFGRQGAAAARGSISSMSAVRKADHSSFSNPEEVVVLHSHFGGSSAVS